MNNLAAGDEVQVVVRIVRWTIFESLSIDNNGVLTRCHVRQPCDKIKGYNLIPGIRYGERLVQILRLFRNGLISLTDVTV
jgi:hypothetical protein